MDIRVYVPGGGHEAYLHALFKSFYPNAQVKITAEAQTGSQPDAALVFCVDREMGALSFRKMPDGFYAAGQISGETQKQQEESFKNFVYCCLRDLTGKELPWGSLMGVRPTKLARKQLEEWQEAEAGRTVNPDPEIRNRIIEFYRNNYYVNREKAELAVDIAARELSVIRRIRHEKSYSLYVGVPFCPTRCLYCSFTSNPIAGCRELVEPYLEATIKDIRQTARIMEGRAPDSVYIGGGTPTALSADQLRRLMEAVAESFDLSEVLEYTVEAGRADSIDREKLQVIRDCKGRRISVNPQSMNKDTLDRIGRKGTPEQVKQAFLLAREMGFAHINMDLILGLPGEDTQAVKRTLEEVEKLRPDSMTIHSLAVKRGSDLYRRMIEQGISIEWDTRQALELAYETAGRMGLVPYYLYRQKNMTGNLENVGFAKEESPGIYNMLVMEEVQSVAACGPGAISKRVDGGAAGWQQRKDGTVKIQRCENVREIRAYIERIDEMIRRKRELFMKTE